MMRKILGYKKFVIWVAVLAVAGCAIVAVVFLTNPETQEDNVLLQPTDMAESGPGDVGLSGIKDADLSGPGDGGLSRPGDEDLSEAGDGGLSGPGDAGLPEPGDGGLPGPGDENLPEVGDADNLGSGANDGSGDADTPGTGEAVGHETEPVDGSGTGEEPGSETDVSSPEPEDIGSDEEQSPDSTETQSSDSPEPQNTAEPEPEYITGPEIDTGYPEYDALIAEVQEILLDYHNLDIYPEEEKEDRFWPELLWAYPERLGYMTRDLDGNGVEELIFGENSSDAWNGVMYQLYTIADGKVICIFVGGSRSRYYLCDNGCIANEGASSAFECEESYYTYKGTELTLIEAVIYDFGKILYSTEYPYYLEEYPPEVYQDITEEEIEEIEAKYVYEQPQLTPFLKMLPEE